MPDVDPTIDQQVVLPQAVREAAARSEQLLREFSGAEEGDPDVTSQGNQDPEPAAAAPEPAPEPAPRRRRQGSAPVAAEPAAPAAPSEPAVDWEHRARSLEGRVPHLERTNAALLEELTNMRQLLATMQASGDAHVEEPPAPIERLVTDEEVTEYGSDLLDVVGRRAREEVAPELAKRDREIARLTAQLQGVNGVQRATAHDRMNADLDAALPEWRNINVDPKFLAWVGLPDPFSGAIRLDMLKAAYGQCNTNRVLAFFKGFIAEEDALAPEPQPAPSTTQVQKVPLQSLAAPGRAKAPATAPAASPDKPLISRAEISKFYADSAAGRYSKNEPERQRIEREIFAAQREGRITA